MSKSTPVLPPRSRNGKPFFAEAEGRDQAAVQRVLVRTFWAPPDLLSPAPCVRLVLVTPGASRRP